MKNSVAETIGNNVIGNVYGTYQLNQDLRAKVSFGFDLDNLTQNYFAPSYTALGLASQGTGNITRRNITTWQTEYTLNYEHLFNGIHAVDALVGYTYHSTNQSYVSASASRYTDESLKHNNLSGGSLFSAPRSVESDANLHSLLGRINYTLLDRYNATVTLRADRSSRFAANNNWGLFPSLGLSWNVNKEAFIKQPHWLDGLKLRASIGTVGNQEIGDYLYLSTYSTSTTGGTVRYTKENAANANLKWETTVSSNIGIDLSAFHGLLDFSFDAYWKKTNDLLLVVPVDVSIYGVSSQLQNVGNVTNHGIEASLSSNIIRNKNLLWKVNTNFSWNVNRLSKLGLNYTSLLTNSYTILKEGESVNAFYGLIYDGVVQNGEDTSVLPSQNGAKPKPGEAKFRDVNGDKKVDSTDRVVLGQPQPTINFGLSSSISWKNWDAFVLFQGQAGGKVYNSLRRTLELPTDSYNVSSVILNSWTDTNPSSTLPAITDVRPYNYIDSRYVESSDFLRLRTLSVGYRLSIKSLGASVRLSATASNLFTITGYKGYNPEIQSGVDTGDYPASRSFTLGVEITI